MGRLKQKIAEAANLLNVLVSRDTRLHFYMETRRAFALRASDEKLRPLRSGFAAFFKGKHLLYIVNKRVLTKVLHFTFSCRSGFARFQGKNTSELAADVLMLVS